MSPTAVTSLSVGEQDALSSFILRHHHVYHRPIALITSGGTAADLELNPVRYLDNFSTGRRGASSAEQFLKRGYAVIYLWRRGSACPFARILSEEGLGLDQPCYGLDVDCLGNLFRCSPDVENIQTVLAEGGKQRRNTVHNDEDDEQRQAFDTRGSATSSTWKKTKAFHDYTYGSSSSSSLSIHPRLVHNSHVRAALRDREESIRNGTLMLVPYRNVDEYLSKLQILTEALRPCGRTALVYLAAAVSDFYIPREERSVHKIQSRVYAVKNEKETTTSDNKTVVTGANSVVDSSGESDLAGCLVLTLKPVPKKISELRTKWSPQAFVVSFKLETDESILERKARSAIANYGVHLVVGNILQTRNDKVWLFDGNDDDDRGGGDGVESSIERQGKASAAKNPAKVVERNHHKQGFHDNGRHQELDLEYTIVDHVTQCHFAYIALGGPDCAGVTMSSIPDDQEQRKAHHDNLKRRQRTIRWTLWKYRFRDLLLNVGGSVLGMYISYWISMALRKRLYHDSSSSGRRYG